MRLFFRLFDSGISVQIFAVVMMLASVASIIVYCKWQRRYKTILLIWLFACLFLMLYSAVFRREPHDEISINLVPLWSIKAIREGYIETLYEKIYNTRTGTCEIDDVICNTVGCVVGAIIGITLWRLCHILSRQDR